MRAPEAKMWIQIQSSKARGVEATLDVLIGEAAVGRTQPDRHLANTVGYWFVALAAALTLIGLGLSVPENRPPAPKDPPQVGKMPYGRAPVPTVPEAARPFPTRW